MTTPRYVREAAKDIGASGMQKHGDINFYANIMGNILRHQKLLNSRTYIVR